MPQALSSEEQLDAAFDGAWEELSGDTGEEKAATTETKETPEIEESGAEEKPSDAVEDTGDEQSAEIAEGETVETEPDPSAVIEPPSDFNAEEMEAFKALPSEAQQLLVGYAQRSQSSRSELSTKYDGLEKSLGPVSEALKPYEAYIAQSGMSNGQVIAGLMPYYANLALGSQDQKRNAIETLARTFGVEMNAPQEQSEDQYVEPIVQELATKFENLERSLQQRQVQEAHAAQQQLVSEVDAFKNATDDKGVLKHPHFDKLREEMGRQVAGNPNLTIDQAYERAILLDPEIQKAEQKAREEAKLKEATKKAEAAKKDSAANKKAKGAPAKKNEGMSMSDAVDDAADALYG